MPCRRNAARRCLYEISKRLLSTRGLENIIDLTNETLVTLFERSVVFYTQIPNAEQNGAARTAPGDVDEAVLHSPDEKAVAHWVFVNQKRAGSGTDTLMGANAFYMPLISQGTGNRRLGRFLQKERARS